MSTLSTRQRLTQAALDLFLSQGVGNTTTRQIADKAGVNEATLFRNFGNKYGLLLAMLQTTPAIATEPQLLPASTSSEGLRAYASDCLQLLEQVSSFVRSIIGEADQYPLEHREALQQRLSAIRQDMAQHLQLFEGSGELALGLSPDELASFLGVLLLGYTLVESTSGYSLWDSREDFLDAIVTVLEPADGRAVGAAQHLADDEAVVATVAATSEALEDRANLSPANTLSDLPAVWVHQLMKQARNQSLQDHALAYVLFGAGLLPEEIIQLEKAHQICDKSQNVLQVMGPSSPRQVPINQWILGKRYGSYTNNPLTKWLKSRKDDASAMFVDESGNPLTAASLADCWKGWWQNMEVGALRPQPDQARKTWCVEMLMRGISLEDLSILAGCEVAELEVYAQRAREKAAIAAATQLDRKVANSN
ncbi:MAG: TetR family transcriptional regulator [Cyanobacteria bacterium P01_H01_bin.58]